MDKEERQKIRKRITFASLGLLVLALVLLIWIGVTQAVSTIWFGVVVVIFLIVYWVLLDIVEPRLLREFDHKSQEQKMSYVKYAAADLIGYAGIAYFIFKIGSGGNSGLIGAVVYVLCISLKRRFRDKFLGVVPTQETQETQEDQDAQQEPGLQTEQEEQERLLSQDDTEIQYNQTEEKDQQE